MIFIDTGAFVARYLYEDQYHEQAMVSWEKLKKGSSRCWTSNLILNETITFLARKVGNQVASERARRLFSSDELAILRPDETDEQEAVGYFERYADQRVSFTDCISFALMRRHRLSHAFAYDKHFQLAGFRLWG